MQDPPFLPKDRRISVQGHSDDLVRLCEEYFEIAIGFRRPSSEEKREANERMLRGGLLGENQTLEDRIKVLKYPLSTDQRPFIRIVYQIEYDIFEFLSQESNLVDGPFIPMLRYERTMQNELLEEGKYDTAILRQSAFIETFIKMKIGQWKDSNGNFLSWELCLESAYRGEELISKIERDKLRTLAKVRNRFAHDWRSLATRPKSDFPDIEKASRCGGEVLSALYGRELKRVYEDYTNQYISNVLPIGWSDRDKSEVEVGTTRVLVEISCDNCGYEFYPYEEGWKRCPKCDVPHDWLENYG
ncbi:hypothetical protein [Halobellus limi]|uniref:Uncharacterized protein n=1 Tax=Halobellus limi TaxID=699433 RepID=A0A1H5VWH7_9EURY|nr:hypothetical protein [Halobellus limi]SEF91336.1 hypothetical protein SAMN04488133_1086 [Halobellus limi]